MAEELEGFSFAQPLLFVLVVEEGAVLGQLHDHVHRIILYEGVPQLHDVRMVYSSMQVNFALEQKQLVLTASFAQIDLIYMTITTLTA